MGVITAEPPYHAQLWEYPPPELKVWCGGGGGVLHQMSCRESSTCWQYAPNWIWDFINKKGKNNKIKNQVEIWYKMVQNCQMKDYGEELGQC